MPKIVSFVALMLLALCFLSSPAMADENEVWWSAAQKEAVEDGYNLITTEELALILHSLKKTVIVDARADYEYEGGHIPGAVNLEFDLGDRTDLSQEKRAAFIELLGPEKDRRIVLYCRSFR